ncbi:hypothetical protein NC77_00685 [Janthinobacterium lividum]|nr:hypothetical protein NC77_00685 [Janthinobacterium lividum]
MLEQRKAVHDQAAALKEALRRNSARADTPPAHGRRRIAVTGISCLSEMRNTSYIKMRMIRNTI